MAGARPREADEERRESRAAPGSTADESEEARLPEPAGDGDAPISAEATKSTRGAGSNGEAARAARPAADAAPSAQAGPPFGIWPLVHAYRSVGHQAANLDPLGLLEVPETVELDPAHHGFTEADLDREYPTGGLFGTSRAPLRPVIERLKRTYSGSIGLESVHIQNPGKREWLHRRMERHATTMPPPSVIRRAMLDKLIGAEPFERFCHTKYPGTKRFSLEGVGGARSRCSSRC